MKWWGNYSLIRIRVLLRVARNLFTKQRKHRVDLIHAQPDGSGLERNRNARLRSTRYLAEEAARKGRQCRTTTTTMPGQ